MYLNAYVRSEPQRFMPSALQMKVQPTGPLADIVGTKKLTRGQITKKLWAHIKKHELQGSLANGDTCKFGGKTYKGGQVIFCETDKMDNLCKKDKIAMTELTKIANKYID